MNIHRSKFADGCVIALNFRYFFGTKKNLINKNLATNYLLIDIFILLIAAPAQCR